MRILIFENSSGFSNYTHKLANHLSLLSGNEVYYLTNKNNRNIANMGERVHIICDLKEYKKYKKNSLSWFINRIFISFHNIRIRNAICKNDNFDIVSIQSTIPIIDSRMIKRIKKTKVFITVHDVIPPIQSHYWSINSLRRMYKASYKLIVHTEENKKQLVTTFDINESKIAVIPHGTDVDYDKKHIIQNAFSFSKEKIKILFYGMIREQKGLDDLLYSLKGLDNVQLVIAGNMPYGESFSRYDELITLNRIDCVKMISFIPEELVDSLFCSIDIVCLPYKYFYSQSGVFMQCLKYKKPVVVSNVSSFKEFMDKYRIGVIFQPLDRNDLRNKIVELITMIKDDNKNMELLQNLECAARENSWEVASKQYCSFFLDSMRVSQWK